MRVRLLSAAVLAALAVASGAAARTPLTLLLANGHGRSSVAVGADTARLHGRVWLDRQGGVGVAHGRATISCETKKTAPGSGFTMQWFRFTLAPGSRQEVWRYGGDACAISVSLHGRGELSVTLRGY